MREKFNNYTQSRPRTRKIAGWTLVVFGFVALVAPIVPGAPIMFIGFEILGIRMLLTDTMKRVFIRKSKHNPIDGVAVPEKVG